MLVAPPIATLFSFFIPGLGQLMVGYEKRGLYFICCYVFLFIVNIICDEIFFLSCMFSVITLMFAVYAAYDTYKLGKISA